MIDIPFSKDDATYHRMGTFLQTLPDDHLYVIQLFNEDNSKWSMLSVMYTIQEARGIVFDAKTLHKDRVYRIARITRYLPYDQIDPVIMSFVK